MTAAAPEFETVFDLYEQRRPAMSSWVARHYVAEFGLEPCPMLDAACGEGFWSDLFADYGFDVWGFDIDESYINAGRRKYPRVQFGVADVMGDLPYEAGAFPLVLARMIPVFYAERLGGMQATLANLLPLVAPGGMLLVSIYSDGSDERRPGMSGGSFWHHPHEVYLRLVAGLGEVSHHATTGSYLQIAVRT